jgi:transposase
MATTIETLWKKHRNKSLIARLTGHDWKTIDKVVKTLEAGNIYPQKKPHSRLLDPHKEQVVKFIEDGLSAVRIHEELKLTGISIGYTTVKDYVKLIKGNEKVFMRIHTDPGEEAQVDFGYAGLTMDNSGKKRKTWVFNMRLSYSRLDYYQKVYDQRVETFIECHINAFKYFGGVPKYVKIDNLKAAILKANFYEPVFQQLYKSFAEYCGFSPIPCRIYQPNDKGKVESGIAYVKGNFFAGRKFDNEDQLDIALKNWLDNKCNQRMHGTTKKVPRVVFESKEKEKLLSLPSVDFAMPLVGSRKVYHDCHIYVEHNYYSVPFEFVGKVVEISLCKKTLSGGNTCSARRPRQLFNQ